MLQVLISSSKPAAQGRWGMFTSSVSAMCAVLCCYSAQEQFLWMVKGTGNKKTQPFTAYFFCGAGSPLG